MDARWDIAPTCYPSAVRCQWRSCPVTSWGLRAPSHSRSACAHHGGKLENGGELTKSSISGKRNLICKRHVASKHGCCYCKKGYPASTAPSQNHKARPPRLAGFAPCCQVGTASRKGGFPPLPAPLMPVPPGDPEVRRARAARVVLGGDLVHKTVCMHRQNVEGP